jgi:PAS domain S-box-containing protein
MNTVHQGPSIRILLLEDSDIDAELLVSHLERAQLRFELVRARRRQEYIDALANGGTDIDIVLADYSLPDFDGLSALAMARSARADLPFIFVSGVVGEDFATDALKQGAIDYILKRNLARLPKAVERAMAEMEEREKRRRIEAALSETEARLRLAAEIAEIGVWSLDPQTGEMQWDDWMRELAGVTSQAEIGFSGTFLPSVHRDDRERVASAFEAALWPDGHPRIDLRFRLIGVLNSRERWLAVNGRRFDEPDGRMRMIGTARDITLERRKDEALRQANETLEARIAERTRERDRIWRLSPELMDVLRPDGSFVAVNPAWETMLGWTEQELVDTHFLRLVHPEDAQTTRGEMMRLDAGEVTIRFDNRCRVRDGSYRWIRWTASPDQGFFYAIGRDVT